MAKGLRFFGTDYLEASFGNTLGASSAADKQDFMFDGQKTTKWVSDGEDSDGNEISIEVTLGATRTLDSFFIYGTNIEDPEVQYYSGSEWVTVNESIATIITSDAGDHVFVKADSSFSATKVKLVGSDTITPDEEKEVTLFMAFLEIGQFEYFPDFTPKNKITQSKFTTSDGRNVIIDRGECFEASIKFKSHVNQNDITLAEELLSSKKPFFIWPCGGDTSLFSYSFYPYKFENIFKVAINGDNSPKVTNNYYKAGYNNELKLVEVS